MARSGIRKIALAAGGLSTLAAATAAAGLISMLVNHPDQIVRAMERGDVFDLIALVFRRAVSIYMGVLRLL